MGRSKVVDDTDLQEILAMRDEFGILQKDISQMQTQSMHDEMMDLMDASNEIQETLGRSYNVPDDIDEEQLMGELDALEADMDFESNSVPSYLQPDKETDLDSELNLPAAPSGHATIPANRQQIDIYVYRFNKVEHQGAHETGGRAQGSFELRTAEWQADTLVNIEDPKV
uniref:Charged multivesicular body protein 5 n=1 Tax=Aegilops tauschii TaxID=37682 RepID=M8BCU5_AEGTA